MRALLKTGEWVEIDTKYLFNNQYNTLPPHNKRIFDAEIQRIEDDVRDGMGKCKFCGAVVGRGGEQMHFHHKEDKTCMECWWYRDRLIETVHKPAIEEKIVNSDDTVTIRTIKEYSQTYERCCTYKGECVKFECRKHGIEWFTPENTFFLKYPNGLPAITDIDKLKIRRFDVTSGFRYAPYWEKIGTYNLAAWLRLDDCGNPESVEHFNIHNSKRNYNFLMDGSKFIIVDSLDNEVHKTLPGIPVKVVDAVRKICAL